MNDRVDNLFPEGDVDDDGDTDADDSILVMNYLTENVGSLPNPTDADADADSDIDARDVALIRAFYDGLIWVLPRYGMAP